MAQAYLDEEIFAAGRLSRSLHSGFGRWVRFVIIVFGATAIGILALLPFVAWPSDVIGLTFIASCPALGLVFLERYAHGVIKGNTAFTEDAVEVLSDDLEFPAFLDRLFDNPRLGYLLLKLALPPNFFNKNIVRTRNQVLVAAKGLAAGRPVDLGDLLRLAIQESPTVLQALEAQHLSQDDLLNVLTWEREREEAGHLSRNSLDPDQLILTGGFAKDWAAGYTLLLDRYSSDLTSLFANKKTRLHIVGHRRVIDEIARNLSKSNKSNVLLVGDPGVGKKTAVLGFTQAVYQGKTLPELSWKHVKMLDLPHLTAGADPETIEVRLLTVLNEAARAGNVILFLDDLETILGGRGASGEGERVSGVVDASAVLSKFLSSDRIQIIATTTYDAYHRVIEKNAVLHSQFEKIEVGEPTIPETTLITLDASLGLESEYKVLITLAAVKEVVRLADRFLHEAPFPEKALDLLEEVAVFVSRQTKEKIVLPRDVQEIVHRKTEIPVAEATHAEKDVLMNLEASLHRRVVDQTEAIAVVADALRRARAGLKERGKPIGTFLFLGPTGVGKTETAKAVAEAYFGSENHMIRLDMNEYVQPEAADRFQEQLTTRAKEDPYTLILLDEIEKSHQAVMNLLLRVLDEGKMADSGGRSVDFTNTIMVATSNAGAELIRQSLLANQEPTIGNQQSNNESRMSSYRELKASLLDYLQKQGIFAPEFLNRFDAVVLFQPLTPAQIAQVVELMLNRLNRQLQEQGIKVYLDQAAVEKLAKVGYDPVFGARALRRTIQEKVENVLAKKILTGQVQSGQEIRLGVKDI